MSTVQLEENTQKDLVVKTEDGRQNQWLQSVSFIKLRNSVVLCMYDNSETSAVKRVHFKRLEDDKPDYILRTMSNLRYWHTRNFLIPLSTSGFAFIVSAENAIHFVPFYIPFLNKLENIFKFFSYEKITYELQEFEENSTSVEAKEKYCSNILFSEFNGGVALLLLKSGGKFGLTPSLSVTFYSPEGLVRHKCFLKCSNDGKLVLQSPVCMTSTFYNTLVVCESQEDSQHIIEIDVDGNIINEVNILGHINGQIKAVTCDVNGNIYIAGNKEIVRISERGQTIRECLSLKKVVEFTCIVDIMYSEKTKLLYVLFEKNENMAVMNREERCFQFVSFHIITL